MGYPLLIQLPRSLRPRITGGSENGNGGREGRRSDQLIWPSIRDLQKGLVRAHFSWVLIPPSSDAEPRVFWRIWVTRIAAGKRGLIAAARQAQPRLESWEGSSRATGFQHQKSFLWRNGGRVGGIQQKYYGGGHSACSYVTISALGSFLGRGFFINRVCVCACMQRKPTSWFCFRLSWRQACEQGDLLWSLVSHPVFACLCFYLEIQRNKRSFSYVFFFPLFDLKKKKKYLWRVW